MIPTQLVVEGETITVPLEGVIDIAAERDRLTKALAAAAKERDALAGRLNNPSFVERAKQSPIRTVTASPAAELGREFVRDAPIDLRLIGARQHVPVDVVQRNACLAAISCNSIRTFFAPQTRLDAAAR